MDEYKLMESDDRELFEEIVTEHLRTGWSLYGGTIITVYRVKDEQGDDENNTFYAQAMVR